MIWRRGHFWDHGDCGYSDEHFEVGPQVFPPGEAALAPPGFLICEGCGSSMTDEDLIALREKRPGTLSCCPERKMRPITRADWVGLKQRQGFGTAGAEARWIADSEAGAYDEDMPAQPQGEPCAACGGSGEVLPLRAGRIERGNEPLPSCNGTGGR
jgi:hypothetical protein